MTVQELIAKLQTMPPDADVIYRCCSDWDLLEADEVELRTAEESERLAKESKTGYSRTISYRGGRYCTGYPLSTTEKGIRAVAVAALVEADLVNHWGEVRGEVCKFNATLRQREKNIPVQIEIVRSSKEAPDGNKTITFLTSCIIRYR